MEAAAASPTSRLGAQPYPGGTRFSLFATTASEVWVQLYERPGVPGARHRMTASQDHVFSASVSGVSAGALYQFVLDGRELPDPFALWLPHGVHGPAQVWSSRHEWRHRPSVSRPLRQQVFYELHVGSFTEEGTYRGAMRRLGELADLGITTVELMPVAAFAGERGWGYDGVALYAPQASYGTPDDLRAFVDDAHARGLAVVLDAVYNHFGPAGNYLSAYSPDYFTSEVRNAWGDAPNFAHPMVRRYVLDNAMYWLDEFRFDGLRLDATHAVIDRSARHILAELADLVADRAPGKMLIAEDEHNDPRCVEDWGLDGVWADDFHHQVRVTLTGESDGYYAAYRGGAQGLSETIRNGWFYEGQVYLPTGRSRGKAAPGLPAEAFFYCLQNHDQIGNRALGDRLSHAVDPASYRAVSALLLFLPMTPILFMGQEWAASTPFQFFTDHDAELGKLISEGRRREFAGFRAFADPAVREKIPDPQHAATFQNSKLKWEERGQGEHRRVLELYAALLRLRREDPVLRQGGREGLRVEVDGNGDGDGGDAGGGGRGDGKGEVLRVRLAHGGEERVLVLNLGKGSVGLGGRRVLLRTDDGAGSEELKGPAAAIVVG